MNLTCYGIVSHAPELAPARADRAGMDVMEDRFHDRCAPLTIANGWEPL
jgi:hypothetical protein